MEKKLKEIILAWTVRRKIMLFEASIDDLVEEIVQYLSEEKNE